jgi:hypothetical protein
VRLDNRYDGGESDPIEDFDDDLNQDFGASSPSAAASQRKRKCTAAEPAEVINQDRHNLDRDRGRNARVSCRSLATYAVLTYPRYRSQQRLML